MPPWGPTSKAATVGEALNARVLEIIQADYPSAVVYQVLLNEAEFPVALLILQGPLGRFGATCVMETELSAETPLFHVDEGWDLVP